ncbi:MAG: hypothetical protein ACLQHF_16290 [Terracidiphilus sp.]
MLIDPMQEWLRLTPEYRAMSNEALLELYRDFADLTDVAQQILAAELRSRGLDKKIAEEREAAASRNSPWARRDASPFIEPAEEAVQGGLIGSIVGNNSTEPVPDEEEGDSEPDEPVELTWKTVLCECEEQDQAYQIKEVLRRAGIESWIQSRERGLVYTRVLVAADELDRARDLIANPIPQDIIDESRETVPEYEPPRCPSCGAEDPVLESAEPVNAWKCEICGREWTDPALESQQSGPLT